MAYSQIIKAANIMNLDVKGRLFLSNPNAISKSGNVVVAYSANQPGCPKTDCNRSMVILGFSIGSKSLKDNRDMIPW